MPVPTTAEPAFSYPPPRNLGDPATLGQGIQRTMALLAGSTAQHRNTVKILFYGQSITEQDWWKEVSRDLHQRFPNANLIIENRALGGFASQLLSRTTGTDVPSFYPDLMIFHVYGAHTNYEEIIRETRSRTTSEVLIQTDHVARDEDLQEPTDPAHLYPDGKIWNSFMNYRFLPDLARRYHCGIVDQRNLWKEYLRDYHLHASQLLKDGVHQNAFGNFLMAEIVKAYLVRRGGTHIDPMNCATLRTHEVGKEIHWQHGRLRLPFEGNRIDLIARPGSSPPATIVIDGRKPSAFPELYGFTRALSDPGGKWPVILKVGTHAAVQVEDWSLSVTTRSPARYRFRLTGSKTGFDGDGVSDTRFVSNSGRIVINPEDWNVDYSLSLAGIKPPPDHFVVRWSVVPFFEDRFEAPAIHDRAVESVVTVAQGLPNTRHTLEIAGSPTTPIAAVRIYTPPFRDEPLPHAEDEQLTSAD